MDLLPFYVYAFLRPDGTPCYIGKGKGNRWRHDGKYGRNLHLRRIIANAKESGQPLERIKLIENMSEADALSMEAFFIAAVGREAQGGPLVNLTDGGEVGPTGYKHPPELRARHSANRKGRIESPEWRAAISVGLKGKPKSPEHRAAAATSKIGIRQKSGWWSTEEGRAKQRANNLGHTGKRHSEESIRRIKNARMRQDARAKVRMSSAWADRNSIRYNQTLAA